MQEEKSDKKKAFIYARKSKFAKESESIEVQVKKCKDYISLNPSEFEITENDIEVFCDEGWSGKDLKRPEFIKMEKRIKNGECGYVLVYRLDRISRSVADFSNLLKIFNEKKVKFVSATESLNTTTITGQMMMKLISVFAEFERQIIAERVRDNMHKLAESGRWLGGTTPLGFSSEMANNSSHIDWGDNKERTEYKLTPIKDETGTVRLIYKQFLEDQALHKLETYMLNHDIKTRKGKEFTDHTLKEILTNPVYCTADRAAYEYFRAKDCELCVMDGDLDKSRGFIAYNRTQSDKQRTKNPISEWIIAVGKHEGIISGEDWVKAQRIIERNTDKNWRKSKNPVALLSGVLRCSCGSYMRPKNNRPNKNGEQSFVYMCELKDRSKKQKCSSNNLSGNTADNIICDIMLNYDVPENSINSQLDTLRRKLKTVDETHREEIKRLEKQIQAQKTAKKRLFDLIKTVESDEEIPTDFIQEIRNCDSTISSLEDEISQLKKVDERKEKYTAEFLSAESILKTFKSNFDTLSTTEKRDLIRGLFESITWDGENLSVFIHGSR